jgi:hypothetical protein
MSIQNLSRHGDEIEISGRLTDGAYFGPEMIEFSLKNGKKQRAIILSHSMSGDLAWPLAAKSNATLNLRISDNGYSIDTALPVQGLGCILINKNRKDASTLLTAPWFWASHFTTHVSLDDGDGSDSTIASIFSTSDDEVTKSYRQHIHEEHHHGVWPYVSIPLTNGGKIELEFSAGVQYQERFWACAADGSRALLGYHSGHFSLPAFRFEELVWIAERVASEAIPAHTLLLVTACYVPQASPDFVQWIERHLRSLPFVNPSYIPKLAKAMIQMVNGIEWAPDENFGWINNWIYSQRNPKSRLSILNEKDFAFLREFLN